MIGFSAAAGILNDREIEKHSRSLIAEYQIDGKSGSPIGTLSGGNIQKVILARELEAAGDLVLFSEPTWGLDVAGSEFIYEKILAAKAGGAAVVLLSSNIDEILALSDEIMVLYRGRIVMRKEAGAEITRESIGEYMLGLKDDFAEAEFEN